MSIYAFHINKNTEQFGWRLFPGTFSEEECDQVIEEHSHIPYNKGGVVNNPDENNDSTVDSLVRIVDTKEVSVDSCGWVYDKLSIIINGANGAFNFELTGFMESMQLLTYKEGSNGFYGVHYDWGPSYLSTRKLTTIVQLTDPSEYDGCELDLIGMGKAPMGKGDVVVFPSFMPHSVSKLTRGQRSALVVWTNGPCFR
jgi:PKHD-type hydroxylase